MDLLSPQFEAELFADHVAIWEVPEVVTNASPPPEDSDLHTTLVEAGAVGQSDGEVYGGEAIALV